MQSYDRITLPLGDTLPLTYSERDHFKTQRLLIRSDAQRFYQGIGGNLVIKQPPRTEPIENAIGQSGWLKLRNTIVLIAQKTKAAIGFFKA